MRSGECDEKVVSVPSTGGAELCCVTVRCATVAHLHTPSEVEELTLR